jgi:hypothetical protein
MPFKTFVAGEILTSSDVNTFLGAQAISVFADATARDAAITSPVEGQFAFRTDDDVLEYWDGTAWEEYVSPAVEFDFLVVAGGGGGGDGGAFAGLQRFGGGGGAGGYRTSVGTSGGASAAEPPFLVKVGSTFQVSVGAGGPANRFRGFDSWAGPIFCAGGGGGGSAGSINAGQGTRGGSAGGGLGGSSAPLGYPKQGSNGGVGGASHLGGGGGGANAAGGSTSGGAGISSSITGTAVTRAVGGSQGTLSAGAANTGNGGGGGNNNNVDNAGSGGSGIVVLKYPDTFSLTIGAGLTSSTTSAGGFKTTIFTAGLDDVTVN